PTRTSSLFPYTTLFRSGGKYITAEDVGISPQDMTWVNMETNHVAGLPGKSGDPSPVTAYGVYVGMKAAAKAQYGSDSLSGKKVRSEEHTSELQSRENLV